MHPPQQLRDLTWAVGSQSLLADGPDVACGDPENAGECHFDPGKIDCDHLADFLSQSASHRVGRYFERLILYWLRHVRRVEILAESLQVRQGNRTVGEIDLLFNDERQRMTHWEIAVKFYLHYPRPNASGSHYIGPNAADTFERKTRRLFDHQLPRSEAFFSDVKAREAFVKGRIFYRRRETAPKQTPARLAPNHLRGTWIRSSEVETLTVNKASYRVLSKPFWLATEVADSSEADLLSPAMLTRLLTDHFTHSDRPMLISSLAAAESSLVETERIFVVSESWPEPPVRENRT